MSIRKTSVFIFLSASIHKRLRQLQGAGEASAHIPEVLCRTGSLVDGTEAICFAACRTHRLSFFIGQKLRCFLHSFCESGSRRSSHSTCPPSYKLLLARFGNASERNTVGSDSLRQPSPRKNVPFCSVGGHLMESKRMES